MQRIWGGELIWLRCKSMGWRVMTTTYGFNGFFLWWFEAISLIIYDECWQSWAISSASCVLRSYLGLSFRTWKKWPLCCYVSWRRSFHPPSSIRCSICSYTFRTRHRWGGLCSTIGAIQLRDVRRSFERNAKINVKLKLLLQSHIFWRRCQISLQSEPGQRDCL